MFYRPPRVPLCPRSDRTSSAPASFLSFLLSFFLSFSPNSPDYPFHAMDVEEECCHRNRPSFEFSKRVKTRGFQAFQVSVETSSSVVVVALRRRYTHVYIYMYIYIYIKRDRQIAVVGVIKSGNVRFKRSNGDRNVPSCSVSLSLSLPSFHDPFHPRTLFFSLSLPPPWGFFSRSRRCTHVAIYERRGREGGRGREKGKKGTAREGTEAKWRV